MFMAIFVGSLALVGVSRADAQDMPQDTMDKTSPTPQHHEDNAEMRHDQKATEQKIRNRIKTLHDKLGITEAEEPKWEIVAQTMRDNEDSISQLMKQRYENRKSMTVIGVAPVSWTETGQT